ncbi:MAG: IS3 family transposase [Tidjanibacter sp.]|nr:IS3 family transposase [Tidjanibacter sp.]
MVGISRQKYYRAGWRTHNKQSIAAQVVSMVLPVRRQMPRIGGKKLYYLLQEPLSALGVGRDGFFDILRANSMLVEPKRQYRTTTDSKHMFRKHKNLVLDYVLVRPEEVWVSDITYIGNSKNHVYLALVTDAYSKKVVGYDLSDRLEASGAVRALRMANRMRQYDKEPLIHHSDRGIQYCCDEYQKELKRTGLQVSMTESYDPYANAVAERVNGILKQEFLLEELDTDLPTMRKIVGQSVATYNGLRPHLSCGMLTPNQMHRQREVKIKTYRRKLEQPAGCSN